MNRIYNFSAGPSVLPESVLKQAQDELVEYQNYGMSVLEMSHRSKQYDDIIKTAEKLLREIMNIPGNYKVLFVQGGASTQFAMIPLNLFRSSKKADVIDTGTWADKFIKEASRYGVIRVVASSADRNYSYIPKLDSTTYDPEADFFHITMNNTIEGTRYSELPNTGAVPLVADMSSNILSEVFDVTKFGLIYAGAQKNMGPAGVTIVIIREDLIGSAMDITPTMLNYKTHELESSMYNTPPTFSIYICKLVFEWIKDQGGVAAIQKMNEQKATILYDYLDRSKLFKGTVEKKDRSLMNVTFITGNPELDTKFIKEAEANGMVDLKGHRLVGGMRASIYNAMPVEGVQKLVDFMRLFEKNN